MIPKYSWIASFGLDENTHFKGEIEYFIQQQPIFKNHSITIEDCYSDFKPGKVYEPLYLMSLVRSNSTVKSGFSSDAFISYLGVVYKNRHFPLLIKNYLIKDLLFETDSTYLTDLQRRPLIKGGNPTLKTTFRGLPYRQPTGDTIKWQLLSGEMDESLVRKVYAYNSTSPFATATRYFYHTDHYPERNEVRKETYPLWQDKVYLSYGGDSTQYVPNIGDKSDIAYYSPTYKAHIELDYDNIETLYETKTY